MSASPRRSHGRDLLFLAVSTLFAAAAFSAWSLALDQVPGVYASRALLASFPIAALAMYTTLAIGLPAALVQMLVAAPLLDQIGDAGLRLSPQLLVAGSVAAALAARCTRRNDVLQAGVWSGLAGAAAAVAVTLAAGPLSPSAAALASAASMAGGILSGPLLLAVSPAIEWTFGHITLLGLLDALSFDHPLLRRLMTRAPGTFQHSVNVSLLADAGARAIGANPLMARVGALYHDVGKTEAPAYFIENQSGPNPHDAMVPLDSARIFCAHVLDGVALVRQHGLGERVADFVREHHGTSEMRSLTAKLDEEPRDRSAFRYPGPRPQTPETGVLMIVDQVEATARAKKPTSEAECAQLVRSTIERLQKSRQLADSRIDDRAASLLTPAVARTLHAMHHSRQDYPEERPRRRRRFFPAMRRRAGAPA